MEDTTNSSVNAETANTAPVNAPETTPTPTAEPAGKKKTKLSEFWDKLKKSPLFIGNRKFISIPILAIALAAIIVVPIVIFHPDLGFFNLGPEPPISLEEFNDWYFNTATSIGEIASSRGVDEALAEVDRQINRHVGNDDQIRGLYSIKRSVLIGDGQPEAAIEAHKDLMNYVDGKRSLKERYHELASMYERNDNILEAINAYTTARDMAVELGEERHADFHAAWYNNKIAELNAKLGAQINPNGAQNE